MPGPLYLEVSSRPDSAFGLGQNECQALLFEGIGRESTEIVAMFGTAAARMSQQNCDDSLSAGAFLVFPMTLGESSLSKDNFALQRCSRGPNGVGFLETERSGGNNGAIKNRVPFSTFLL